MADEIELDDTGAAQLTGDALAAFKVAMLNTVGGQQVALNAVGAISPPLNIDQINGPLTIQATKNFQTSRSIGVDGIWGPQTKAAMVAALSDDAYQDLINAGLPSDQAAAIAQNEGNATALPGTPTSPSSADILTIPSVVIQGGSATLQPLPASDVPGQPSASAPTGGYMAQVKAYATAHPAVAIGGGVAALGLVGLAVHFATK